MTYPLNRRLPELFRDVRWFHTVFISLFTAYVNRLLTVIICCVSSIFAGPGHRCQGWRSSTRSAQSLAVLPGTGRVRRRGRRFALPSQDIAVVRPAGMLQVPAAVWQHRDSFVLTSQARRGPRVRRRCSHSNEVLTGVADCYWLLAHGNDVSATGTSPRRLSKTWERDKRGISII